MRRFLGDAGERYAALFLEDQGYRIVRKNFRSRGGEIDLIAKDGDVLVFVEVKTRRSLLFGQPFEAVDGKKRQRMIRAALTYLRELAEIPPCRFDVVSVMSAQGRHRAELLRDAFEMGNQV